MTDRAQLESRIMAEMAALAASEHEYAELVRIVLDLVEEVVSSPVLSLSVEESDGIRHYHRFGVGVDREWSRQAVLLAGETARRQRGKPSTRRHEQYHPNPPTWVVLFPAGTRSNRSSALILAAQEELIVAPHEEQLMLRLARQALLVLDHALLLRQVEDLEVVDRLTGVQNHRRLLELLEYEMARHRYTGNRLALLVVDIEGLERINRSYGRQYGNHVLRRLAGLLQETVRPIDVVARSGLDEFAVVLPEIGEEEAERLADLVGEQILGVEFAGGAVGVTVGLAQVRPGETLSAEDLLQRAEWSLKEAKRHDRAQSTLWTVSAPKRS